MPKTLVSLLAAAWWLAASPQSRPTSVGGQTATPIPTSIEAAEAEGAAHPKGVGPLATLYAEAFGSTERKCADAEGHVAVRSGDFVAGAFDRYWHMGLSGRKVWWTPRQTTETWPALQLRAAKLDAPDVTANWSFGSVVSNSNGYFYNTLFTLPQTGRWLVVVTSGNNWGCFILTEIYESK